MDLSTLEIPISKNTVDLCLECNVHTCCMGFWYDICSFKQRKNECSIDVMTWAYVDLHGFTDKTQPLEALETLRMIFSDLFRFFVLISKK